MSILRLMAGAALAVAGVNASGCDEPGGTQARGREEHGQADTDARAGGHQARIEAEDPVVPLTLASPGQQPSQAELASDADAADLRDDPLQVSARSTDASGDGNRRDVSDEAEASGEDGDGQEQPAPAIDQLAREMRELAIMALQTRKKLLNLSVSDPFVDETQTLEEVSDEMREITKSSILTRKALLELRFDEDGKASAGTADPGKAGESAETGDKGGDGETQKQNDKPESGEADAKPRSKAAADEPPK